MKYSWLMIALLCPAVIFSQQGESKTRPASIVSVGFATGQSSAKPIFQWSGGLRYGRYFSGLGIGIDQYKFNSVPIFADWRVGFGKQGLGFLYANAGYNLAGKNNTSDDRWFKTTDRLYGGFYLDAGIGYRIRLSNSMHRLLFSAGYSHKTMSNKIGYTYECFVPPCPEELYTYKYELGRIIAKFSWEFGR